MLNLSLRHKLKKYLDIFLSIIGVASLFLLIVVVGFYLNSSEIGLIDNAAKAVIGLFLLHELLKIFTSVSVIKHLREQWSGLAISLFLLFSIFLKSQEIFLIRDLLIGLTERQALILYLSLIQMFILFSILIKALRYNYLLSRTKLNPGAIFTLSFALIIMMGTAMLMLPRATPDGGMDFVDALFTSTSAVCVTGLIVVDTATALAPFGKLVVLGLIQVGGLGIMTLTTFFALFISGGLSIRMNIMMKDLLSSDNLSEVKSLLIKIILFVGTIELLGALFLYLSLGGSLHAVNMSLIYSAVFHSISAFCNAGFSIYSSGMAEPFIQSNYSFGFVVMILIILGGLGFAVLSELFNYKKYIFRRTIGRASFSINTKISLLMTLILIFGGALMIYLFEPFYFEANFSTFDKLYHSLFSSVTARTAGFNTIDISKLGYPALLLIIFLMWIGASPGGTGGGIKTTTFFVGFRSLVNILMSRQKLHIFRRSISIDSVEKSYFVIISTLTAICLGYFTLVVIEPDKDPIDLLFEAVSAIGTVGLSRNITFYLGDGAKLVVVLLMFIGRIGVVNFLLAFIKERKDPKYSLPDQSIMIG